MSEPYTAADLVKELRKVVAKLEEPVSVDFAAIKGQIDALEVDDHESLRSAPEDLLRSASRAESAIGTASNARKKAREAITDYLQMRFSVTAVAAGGPQGGATDRPGIPTPPPAPLGTLHSADWEQTRSEMLASDPLSGVDLAELIKSWLDKVRAWALRARDWLLSHAQTIDSIFLIYDAWSRVLNPLIPLLDPLVGGFATPAWFAVQLGMTSADYAWALIKGYGEDTEWDRSLETAKFLVGLQDVLGLEMYGMNGAVLKEWRMLLETAVDLSFIHDFKSFVHEYMSDP